MAVCQMIISENKDENLQKAEAMIRESALLGANVVTLTEMFNCPYSNDLFASFAEEIPGKTSSMLSDLSKELGIYIIGGSIPEKSGDKIFNSSIIVNNKGEIIDVYRKIHLFDIDIKGKITFRESDTLEYGNKIVVVDTPFCKIGIAICYDIRFPELMRILTLKGAEVIVLPAAFNMTTGSAHWDSLMKMRAIDNQVYFVGAAPARDEDGIFCAYGHSAIVDPWGEKVASLDEKEGIIIGTIDLNYVKEVRNKLPLLKHMRNDLYNIEVNSD